VNDSSPDEIVVELAQRLFDEAAAFVEERGGMTAADTGEALGHLINAGYEELGDCPGCRRKYIDALKRHVAYLELPTGHAH
jgi:hypothetical protein